MWGLRDSDDALVERARLGERRAFGALVARYLRSAYAIAYTVVGTAEDAEDVSQDAFVAALRGLDELAPGARFAPWLFAVVRNRALDVRRRQMVRAGEPLVEETAAAPAIDGPERSVERRELEERLRAALGELTDTQREVLLLHDLDGWKHREIADALGLSASTVRVHLSNARRAMREQLTQELLEGL